MAFYPPAQFSLSFSSTNAHGKEQASQKVAKNLCEPSAISKYCRKITL